MSTLRDLETRQEARFVLWALRSAICRVRGDEEAGTELARGFALAGVAATTDTFEDFTRALFAMEWPLEVWHGPRCCCISNEEVFILNALAETAARQRLRDDTAAQWWRLVLPAERIGAVDTAARTWLSGLAGAGVEFPAPDHLHNCLAPLQLLAGPAHAEEQRLH